MNNEVPWAEFKLTASIGDEIDTEIIIGQADYMSRQIAEHFGEGDPEAAAIELDAHMTAIVAVLTNAGPFSPKRDKARLWREGRIVLTDSSTGRILHDSETEVMV